MGAFILLLVIIAGRGPDRRRHVQRPGRPGTGWKRLAPDRRAAEAAASTSSPTWWRRSRATRLTRRKVFEKVTQARAAAVSPARCGQRAQAENMLTGALKTLFAVAEAYPDLKANQNFLMLQEELSGTETKIAFARQFYNDSVMTSTTARSSPEHHRQHVRLQGPASSSRSRRRRTGTAQGPVLQTPGSRCARDTDLGICPRTPAMYEQISRNKWKSAALVVFFIAFIFVLTWFFEYVTGWGKGGLVLAVVVAMGMAAVGYYSSDKIVLGISRARPVTKDEFPYLYNVVEGLAIAAGVPAPKCYVIDDTAPNAFATGREPETRRHLRHDRPPREAQPGRARGRHRPRDVPHQELRRPAPDAGRGDGRRRRPAQRLDAPVVHVGRRRAGAAAATAAAGRRRRRPGPRRPGPGHPLALHRHAHPAGRLAQARVPGRRERGHADPLPGRPGLGPAEDLGRHRARSRRPTRPPPTSTSSIPSRISRAGAASIASSAPTRPSRSASPPSRRCKTRPGEGVPIKGKAGFL